MIKKVTGIIISAVLLSGLTACGEKEKKQVSSNIKLPPMSMLAANSADILETKEFMRKATGAFVS